MPAHPGHPSREWGLRLKKRASCGKRLASDVTRRTLPRRGVRSLVAHVAGVASGGEGAEPLLERNHAPSWGEGGQGPSWREAARRHVAVLDVGDLVGTHIIDVAHARPTPVE